MSHYIMVSDDGTSITYNCANDSWSIAVRKDHQAVADEQLARHLNPHPTSLEARQL